MTAQFFEYVFLFLFIMLKIKLLSALLAMMVPVIMAQEATAAGDVNEHYTKLLNYSMLFYEAQRSGKLPENNRIAWYVSLGVFVCFLFTCL